MVSAGPPKALDQGAADSYPSTVHPIGCGCTIRCDQGTPTETSVCTSQLRGKKSPLTFTLISDPGPDLCVQRQHVDHRTRGNKWSPANRGRGIPQRSLGLSVLWPQLNTVWRLCVLFRNNNLGIWYLKKFSNLRGTDTVKNQKASPGIVADLLTFFVCRFGHASLCSCDSLGAVYDDAFDTESLTGFELDKKWVIQALYPMRIRVLPVCASPALTFMYVALHPEREGRGVVVRVQPVTSLAFLPLCLRQDLFFAATYDRLTSPWASGNSPVSASHATVSLRLQMCVATSGLTSLLGTWTLVSMLACQELYLLSHLPVSHPACFFFFKHRLCGI